MKIKTLIGKFVRTWKEDGLSAAMKKSFRFLGDWEVRSERRREAKEALKNTGDVLFINGCAVLHPTRYRVHHQMEQLELAGMSCRMVYFEHLNPRMEANYRSFLFFRCECTEEVAEFIALAKGHGKPVYFDVDDLVIDTKYTDPVPFVQAFAPLERKVFERGVIRTGKTLEKCDIAITTTEALAAELGKVVPQTYINRNAASKEMIACAEQAYTDAQTQRTPQKENETVWMGYFSGSLTHNQDFAIIRPALVKIMETYPQVRLILVGELAESDELKRFAERIVRKSATDWRNLPRLIVQADINLAPLEDTLFNRAKSEIKWIESALVRVPTIASCVGSYEVMVEDGVTGILCENTAESWYRGMCRLVEDAKLRKAIGENAHQYVMEYCTTVAKADPFAAFIKERIG